MKLNYRGIAYSSDNTLPEIGTHEINGQYRGVQVKLSYHTPQITQPNTILRYRGAAYTSH